MKIFISILILLSLSACIDIKSDYPKISYYGLTQSKTETGVGSHIPGTLLVKDIKFPGQFDTQFIIENFEESKVKKYHYHKWADLPSVLVSDFVRARLNLFEAFTGSIIEPGSKVYPDYILEINYLQYDAVNKKNGSFVDLAAKIVLFKKIKDKPQTETILSEVFTNQTPRENDKIESIAPAFSKAISKITDEMAYVVQNKILEMQ
jgi:ABC-type uncharacterized transport system auxiliary subunit